MVRLVRTNELQHVVYEPYHSTVAGTLRAHQQITTLRGWDSAAAPPGTLHAHQRITTAQPGEIQRKPRVRSVRTNELQLQLHRHQECHLGGAPRAHQRITTVTVPVPSLQLEVRLTRTHELQPELTRQIVKPPLGAPRARP